METQVTRVYETPYKVSELAFTLNDIEGDKTLENWMKACRDTIAEETVYQDENGKKMRKVIQEMAKANEEASRNWNSKRTYTENSSVSEIYRPKWTANRGYSETTGIDENFLSVWNAIRKYEEPANIAEAVKKAVLWRYEEPVSFTEEYGKRWIIVRNYSESFNGTDYITSSTKANFTEGMTALDTVIQKSRSAFQEGIAVEELQKSGFSAIYQESTSIADKTTATVKQGAHEEGMGIVSFYQSGVKMSFAAETSITDGYTRTWLALRRYEESTDVKEGIKNHPKTYKTDGIKIVDKRLRSVANGVLSNIVISEGETAYAIFEQNADQVAGYAPFVEFKVGDYEYEKALFRMSFSRTNLQNDMKFYDYAVHVDIPDTFDRGESAVNGETKIYFNKFYYHAPEVNVTTVGGTTILIPRIISLDNKDETGRYFVVILEDLNGESKAGRISWSARGY